jgi:hypothetical protein
MNSQSREFLLLEVRHFVEAVSKIEGVSRIALIGSLTTQKPNPKDSDVIVTITENINMEALATCGRRLKGRAQSQNMGADIFLCSNTGDYLGRTCSYKECHPRVRCEGSQCKTGSRICNDLEIIKLDSDLLHHPPLILWPDTRQNQSIPGDVEKILIHKIEIQENVQVGWTDMSPVNRPILSVDTTVEVMANPKVRYSELETALEVADSVDMGWSAFVCSKTGNFFYEGDGIEVPVPDDLHDNEQYIQIPDRYALDLGTRLVFEFVRRYYNEDFEEVMRIFHKKGAYSRYKLLLDRRDGLDHWNEFVCESTKKALLEWCARNDIEVEI